MLTEANSLRVDLVRALVTDINTNARAKRFGTLAEIAPLVLGETRPAPKRLAPIKPEHVECYLGEYRRAHGKNPAGLGTWAFKFPGSSEPWFAPGVILFSEARRLAKTEAAKRGHYRCVLGS